MLSHQLRNPGREIVHTSAEAVRRGETEIRRVGQQFRTKGTI
jgi:hypothetical protein